MSDDVLSQAEVESLLAAGQAERLRLTGARQTGCSTAGEATASRSPAAFAASRPGAPPSDMQLRALQEHHEEFADGGAGELSALLRAPVELRLEAVESKTYREVVHSLDAPTCLTRIQVRPLGAHIGLEISPQILFPFIERLLGGGAPTTLTERRPLTEIELLLVSRITAVLTDELVRAWSMIADLELIEDRVECQPQLARIVPSPEGVVVLTFTATLGATSGAMRLCLPRVLVDAICAPVGGGRQADEATSPAPGKVNDVVPGQPGGSRVQLVVTLAESTVSTADLIGLRVGDVITTEKNVRSPLRVDIGGVERFGASPGTFRGKTAIQVVDTIERRRNAS